MEQEDGESNHVIDNVVKVKEKKWFYYPYPEWPDQLEKSGLTLTIEDGIPNGCFKSGECLT
jgi:hypothetical protein